MVATAVAVACTAAAVCWSSTMLPHTGGNLHLKSSSAMRIEQAEHITAHTTEKPLPALAAERRHCPFIVSSGRLWEVDELSSAPWPAPSSGRCVGSRRPNSERLSAAHGGVVMMYLGKLALALACQLLPCLQLISRSHANIVARTPVRPTVRPSSASCGRGASEHVRGALHRFGDRRLQICLDERHADNSRWTIITRSTFPW